MKKFDTLLGYIQSIWLLTSLANQRHAVPLEFLPFPDYKDWSPIQKRPPILLSLATWYCSFFSKTFCFFFCFISWKSFVLHIPSTSMLLIFQEIFVVCFVYEIWDKYPNILYSCKKYLNIFEFFWWVILKLPTCLRFIGYYVDFFFIDTLVFVGRGSVLAF